MYQYELLPENEEEMPHLAMDIYADHFFEDNKSVVAIGDFSEISLNKFQSKSKFAALNLIGIQFLVKYEKYKEKESVYKIRDTDFEDLPVPETNFIMINLNISLLELGLLKIKNSALWNQGGRYIIDSTSSKDSCKNATTFLTVLWKFEILSVIFVCRNAIEDIQFYTYNPFTSRAPDIWTKYQTMKQKNEHPLTLFKHTYNQSKGFPLIQNHLFFDKTSNLAGYPIRIIKYISHSNLPYELHEYGVHVTSMIVSTIWMKLNATVSLFVYPTQQRGGLYKNGYAYGLLDNLFRGEYDMQLNLDYERDFWRNQLYTSIETGICHVAWRNLYRMESNNKIFSTFSIKMVLSFVTMSAIVTVILSRILRVRCLQVAADLFRGILGNPMLHQPSNNSGRIAFFSCSFCFIVANLFFQTKLLSLLATPKFVDRLHTPDDLIDFRYTVYGESRYEQYFYGTAFQHYMNQVNSTHECLQMLIAGSLKVACVCDCWAGNVYAHGHGIDKRLTLLKGKQNSRYFVYIVRDDFPLLKAVRCVYKRLQEGGILKYIQRLFFHVRSMNYNTVDEQVSVMTFSQVSVAFQWLGYGMAIACTVYLCELFIYECVNKEVRSQVTTVTRYIYEAPMRLVKNMLAKLKIEK